MIRSARLDLTEELMNAQDIRKEIERAEAKLVLVLEAGFDEDVVDIAQADLAEAKAAMQRVLDHGEAALPALIAANGEVWRSYRRKLKRAVHFLDSLV